MPRSTLGVSGLSPRERGSHLHRAGRQLHLGAIPARAGEPVKPVSVLTFSRGYPRASGGAIYTPVNLLAVMGLSPRERGSPLDDLVLPTQDGAIPARAGEPSDARRFRVAGWGYPRASGGAFLKPSEPQANTGLSPRERGSHSPDSARSQ